MQSQQSEQLRREKRAIDLFVNMFGGSYQKLDQNDIDYKVFSADGQLIAYAEVSSRVRTMRDVTRGGLGTVLNEIADSSRCGIDAVPGIVTT